MVEGESLTLELYLIMEYNHRDRQGQTLALGPSYYAN